MLSLVRFPSEDLNTRLQANDNSGFRFFDNRSVLHCVAFPKLCVTAVCPTSILTHFLGKAPSLFIVIIIYVVYLITFLESSDYRSADRFSID